MKMTALEFIEKYDGHNPIVTFTKRMEDEIESGFDENQKAKVVRTRIVEDGCIEFVFDFSDFEDHNKTYEKANWFDQNGIARLRWSETKFYPQNKQEEVYFDGALPVDPFFTVVEEEKEVPQEVEALRWVVEQFGKVLAGERAGSVVECLSFAKSVLKKYDK